MKGFNSLITKLMLAACVLCVAPTWAVDYTWTGAGGDNLWTNNNNWTSGAGPGHPDGVDDTAAFPTADNVVINSAISISRLDMTFSVGTMDLQITSTGSLLIEDTNGQSPWMPQDASFQLAAGSALSLGDGVDTSPGFTIDGSITVDGGTFSITDPAALNANGILIINSGTVNLNLPSTFNTAFGSSITFNDGTFDVNSSLSNGGTFDLNGGAVNVANMVSFDNTGTLNFSGGTLEVNGDFSNQGSMVWTGGTWTGTGMSINSISSGLFQIRGAGTKTLDGHILKTQSNSTGILTFMDDGVLDVINTAQLYNEADVSWADNTVINFHNTSRFFNGAMDGSTPLPGSVTWSGNGDMVFNDNSRFTNGATDGISDASGTFAWGGMGNLRFLDNAIGINVVGPMRWEGTGNLEIDLLSVFTNQDNFQYGNIGRMIVGPNGAGNFVNEGDFIRNSLPSRRAGKRMPGPLAEVNATFSSTSGSTVVCESGSLVFNNGGNFSDMTITSRQTSGTDQEIDFAGGTFIFNNPTFAGDQGWAFSGGDCTFTGAATITFPTPGTFFRFSGGNLQGLNGGTPIVLDIQSDDFIIEGNLNKQISNDLNVSPTDPMVVMSGDGNLLFDGQGALTVNSDFQIASDADFLHVSTPPGGVTHLTMNNTFEKTVGVGAANPTVVGVPFAFNRGVTVNAGVLDFASEGNTDRTYSVAGGSEIIFSDGVVRAANTGGFPTNGLNGSGTYRIGSNAEWAHVASATLASTATLLIESGGRLGFVSEFINNGGTVRVTEGVIGSSTVVRGVRTFTNNAGALLEFANTSPMQIDAVFVDNLGDLLWSSNQEVELINGAAIENNQNFEITGEGTMTVGVGGSPGVTNNGVFVKSGVTNVGNASEFAVSFTSAPGSTFDILQGIVAFSNTGSIQTQVDLGDGNSANTAAEFKVQGSNVSLTGNIADNDTSDSFVTVDSGTLTTSGSIEIVGLLEIINGGTLDMSNAGTNNSTQDLFLDGNLINIANLRVGNDFSWQSGTLAGLGGTPFDGSTPPPTPSLLTVTGNFTYAAPAATSITDLDVLIVSLMALQNGAGAMTLNGSGTLRIDTSSYSMDAGTAIGIGPGANAGVAIDERLLMASNGKAVISAPINLNGILQVSNGGILEVVEPLLVNNDVAQDSVRIIGGELQVPGGVQIDAGDITVRDSGQLTGNVTLMGGQLVGDGLIVGNVDNQSGEVVPEGTAVARGAKRAVGNLTVNGSYTQGSTGTLSVEVEEISLDTYQVDTLTVTDATLDGTVDVTFIGNEPVPTRDGYTILSASNSLTGNFGPVNLPPGSGIANAVTEDTGSNEINLVFEGPATATWTGAGDGSTFSMAGNWLNNEVPAFNTDVTIDRAGGSNVVLDRNYEVNSLTIGSSTGTDPQDFNIGGFVFSVAVGATVFSNGGLILGDGGVLADTAISVILDKRRGTTSLDLDGRLRAEGSASIELTQVTSLSTNSDVRVESQSASPATLTMPGFTNFGRVTLGNPGGTDSAGLVLTESGLLVNEGTVESSGDSAAPPTRFINGELRNNAIVTLEAVNFDVGDYDSSSTASLIGNGSINLTGGSTATISLNGQVVPASSGNVRGGGAASIGQLRLMGNTVFQPGMSLEMDINTPTEFDEIEVDVNSSLGLGGALLTRFQGGFQGTAGDRIDLITYGDGLATGDFASVETPPVTNGLIFNPDLGTTSYGIALDPIDPLLTPHLFITDPTHEVGIVYDPSDNSMVSTLMGFGGDANLFFSNDGAFAYLLSFSTGQLDIFDTSTLQITETFFGLTNPVAMAANGDASQLWILEEVSAGIMQLSVYAVGTGTIVQTATPCVNDATMLIYDSGLDRFFVLGSGGDGCTYAANDPATAVDSFTFGGDPADAKFLPTGDYLAISQSLSTEEVVSFMDPATFNIDFETVLPAGAFAGKLDTVSDTEVAVSGGANTVFIVDAADTSNTKRLLDVVDSATFPSAINISGVAHAAAGTIYAADPGSSTTYFDDGDGQGTLMGPPNGTIVFIPTQAGINKDRNFGAPVAGVLQFELADLGSFNEDAGSVSFAVNRVNGTDGALTATISIDVASTATTDVDFVLDTTSVSFGDGDTTPKTVTVTVIDDNAVEGDTPETVILNLVGSALGSPTSSRFAIIDNDEIVDPGENALMLGQDTFVVSEGGGVQVPVIRTGDGVGRVTATLEALSGTAVPSSDYTFPATTVVFEAGQVGTQMVTVQTLDDNFVEFTETFQVTILTVSGIDLGSPSTATISINDNDATQVFWTTASSSVLETTNGKRDASVTVTARLTSPATFPITVPFTVGGTATPGDDHNLSSSSLVFAPGTTQATLNITVFGDNVLEPDETIILTLTGTEAAVGTPAVHTVQIRNDDFNITDVDTRIVNLPDNNRFSEGQMIQLEALGLGGVGGPYTFEWEICNVASGCQTYSGQFINPALDKAGFYVVVARAIDAQGNVDATPAQVRLEVVRDLPPTVEIGFPARDRINLTTGSQQLFVAIAEDAGGGPVTLEWYKSDAPDERRSGREFIASFPEAGTFIVVVEATDSAGQTASDSVEVSVTDQIELPVEFEVTSPSDGTVFATNETVVVNFSFESGSNKKPFSFTILPGDGRRIPASADGASFFYERPGRYFLRALAVDGDRRYEDVVTVFVRNPNMPPVVDIIPATDVTLDLSADPNPGVFFSGLVTNGNGFGELNFFWDFGNGVTSLQRVPGRIPFDEVGTYEVTMFARTPGGQETAAVRRTVNVIQGMQGRYEPNDGFSQAPSLTAGGYGNLVLNEESPVDIYKFEVQKLGQRVTLRFIADAPIIVDIFDENEEPVRSDTLFEGDTLHYTGLEPGFYFCKMTPVEDLAKRKVTLSYSLAIDVLNPAVYFSEINSNALETTEVGLVNLSNSESSVELLGYDGNGSLVSTVDFSLAGSGRVNQRVEQLFGAQDARQIKWIQVNATSKMEGYTRVGSRDGKERYAVSGSKRLSSRLFVPHIAEGVNQWFTRATVVNGGTEQANASIQTPSDSRNLELNEGFAADEFDILDRFDGDLESNIWALFENGSADAVLAGSEVFGTVSNEVRIVAGLELIDNEADDPAFTYVANTLYFTHIASDIDNFWTGLALVNTGDFVQGYRVVGYAGDGTEKLNETYTLQPFEKRVQVAETFLAPSSPAEIEWVKVEADSQIVGFELFGTRNNKTMAGLEASNVLKPEICVPFIDATGEAIHGVSVINPNDDDNRVRMKLFSDAGVQIGETLEIVLAPNVKMLRTLRDLFPDAFAVDGNGEIPGWLAIEGDHPVAGFQLIFEGNGEQMSGLIAQ